MTTKKLKGGIHNNEPTENCHPTHSVQIHSLIHRWHQAPFLQHMAAGFEWYTCPATYSRQIKLATSWWRKSTITTFLQASKYIYQVVRNTSSVGWLYCSMSAGCHSDQLSAHTLGTATYIYSDNMSRQFCWSASSEVLLPSSGRESINTVYCTIVHCLKVAFNTFFFLPLGVRKTSISKPLSGLSAGFVSGNNCLLKFVLVLLHAWVLHLSNKFNIYWCFRSGLVHQLLIKKDSFFIHEFLCSTFFTSHSITLAQCYLCGAGSLQ